MFVLIFFKNTFLKCHTSFVYVGYCISIHVDTFAPLYLKSVGEIKISKFLTSPAQLEAWL